MPKTINSVENELENLGLTKNEAKIYLFLLKNGETTTGLIIKETGISNSRVYESLNSLISKGFVNYNVQKDGKHFQANSPKLIEKMEKEKMEKISKIMPSLLSIQSNSSNKTSNAIYEGYEGFKIAFNKIIEDCPKGEEIKIMGFSQQQYKSENLKLFLANMNTKSAEKKQKLKMIFDVTSKEFQSEIIKAKNTEIRYMPKGYISPAAIDIFQDYVYVFMWEEKPFVFMIKNQQIADSFKTYFDFMWKVAKP